MHPHLFEIPWLGWPINSYGFCIMVGFLLASWIGVRRGKPLGLKSDFILDVGIIGMIFGIVGAKINYLLQYPQEFTGGGQPIWGDMGLNPMGALLLGPIPYLFWWWRTRKRKERVRLLSWRNAVLLALTLVFALVGTRALFLYQHRGDYSWKIFTSWQSGFVFYGGAAAGVAASMLYVKMRGFPIFLMADLCAPLLMLGQAFGRGGCFLNGCCYGLRGDGFPCLEFPPTSPAYAEQVKAHLLSPGSTRSLPVHPTQLYETAACVMFFFLLSWMWRRKRKVQGEVFLLMAIFYSVWRFLIEFVRGDDRPVWIHPLSYSQVVSVAAFAMAGIWLYFLRGKGRGSVEPPASEATAAPPANPA